MPVLNLEATTQKIYSRLEEIEKARDLSYVLHRELIKKAGVVIRAAHRMEKENAYNLLNEAKEILRKSNEAVRGFEELPRTGFIHDAQKEFCEAAITTSIIFNEPIPTPDSLGVSYAPFLRGMAETIGELRRRILDLMRQDRGDEGEYLLEAMEEIYSILVTMDFSDAVTGGLRHSTDQARGILERTRGDFTNHIVSKRLRNDLKNYGESVCSCSGTSI
jgi:translin